MKNQKGSNHARLARRRGVRHHNRTKEPDHVTEMLKLCLQKICELQAELETETDDAHDPEVEGYAACATETMRFLSAQGLSADHPVVKALSERLIRNRD